MLGCDMLLVHNSATEMPINGWWIEEEGGIGYFKTVVPNGKVHGWMESRHGNVFTCEMAAIGKSIHDEMRIVDLLRLIIIGSSKNDYREENRSELFRNEMNVNVLYVIVGFKP